MDLLLLLLAGGGSPRPRGKRSDKSSKFKDKQIVTIKIELFKKQLPYPFGSSGSGFCFFYLTFIDFINYCDVEKSQSAFANN